MKLLKSKLFHFSSVTKFRIKSVLYIGIFWTITDYIDVLLRNPQGLPKHTNSLAIRESFIFIVSLIMGYLFVFKFRRLLKNAPLWLNFLLKSVILLGSALLITFIITYVSNVVILGQSYHKAFESIINYVLYKDWLLQKILYWLIIFFITQLFLLINEKYSPGVFMDILMGRYIQPKIEKRIVMFMDLKDSTPIAEKLGHQVYFKFIRDFIYQASLAVIEFNGRIYQYVGDEIIASWVFEKNNTRKCMDTVIECRRNIQKNSEYFRREYGIVPEFRVGIHLGDVTVGEIGVIKKDLAMSGDTMNTTARIRSAANELNHKFIVSKIFKDNINLEEWQFESLGRVDLKGKGEGIELFSLKI
ncbi:MAG: adenylate/guanylate cyclase domain-containing protein [Chitinophagaceae bacterium]|nr:adenylate/guanylate cyclase domain-containing protein [Chitinophagaceae bacterium]